ncbi:MAG: GatB/YqeY domain-containing protein [Patescibacteria group bacterium]|nr:GatB/YqeY domain-containing protein [Patescibacteria group bacterium]MDD4304110.1 GatB/YqeY domain-containing protein [Patescibacteria group bacterium]MDD4694987.1 GatB/YqeY domain-containing protein [Patescibacteria group bacterium]
MSLKEKIFNDLLTAIKSRDLESVNTLKLLKNSIQNKEKDIKKELDDLEVVSILFSETKKRKDSIEQFQKGGRDDLVKKESFELDIISKYLPQMKTKDEIKNIICDIIEKDKIDKTKPNFGLIMKLAMESLKGQAEGNVVSEVLKEILD